MRKRIAVVGLQTGDEGKGNKVDLLVSEATKMLPADQSYTSGRKPILVERFQGGPNAGHTLRREGHVYKLHQVPSGILTPCTYNLLGEGMYVNPRKLMEEIRQLQLCGINISPDNVGIAATAHMTLDYHVEDDQSQFQRKDHTTTGNGIKQTAVDKYGRVGIRFVEFLDEDIMRQCLQRRFPEGMPSSYGSHALFVQRYAEERNFLSRFLVQQHVVRQHHGTEFWIGEGAQGFLLDVDAGQYPGITSSHPAQVPHLADTILGVVKLYCSSVGTGDRPFMSRMEWDLEESLRNSWGEFGTTTGKGRELGWFDAVAVKYAIDATGTDYLIATCGDRLEELGRRGKPVKLVTGYKIGSREFREWDVSFHRRDVLRNAEPLVEEFEPWEHFVGEDGKVTPNAQRYLDRIQELTGKEIIMLGTGPGRDDVIMYKNPWDL